MATLLMEKSNETQDCPVLNFTFEVENTKEFVIDATLENSESMAEVAADKTPVLDTVIEAEDIEALIVDSSLDNLMILQILLVFQLKIYLSKQVPDLL